MCALAELLLNRRPRSSSTAGFLTLLVADATGSLDQGIAACVQRPQAEKKQQEVSFLCAGVVVVELHGQRVDVLQISARARAHCLSADLAAADPVT
jgi:hypothetical protein